MSSGLVTCKACGWVSFAVTRKFAENAVRRFNEYFDRLTYEQQQAYYGGGKSSIQDYELCFRCGGGYKNFRKAKKDDCPSGCTINPIIRKKD